MDYVVDVTLMANRPLTEDGLMSVAAVGGAASGNAGEKRLETTLTVKAGSVSDAVGKAGSVVIGLVAGTVVAATAATVEEADRRDAAGGLELVGVTEVAAMLGISKQRITVLSRRDDFPDPVAKLASGPVWRKGDLSTFADGWKRQPGRPKGYVIVQDGAVVGRRIPPLGVVFGGTSTAPAGRIRARVDRHTMAHCSVKDDTDRSIKSAPLKPRGKHATS